MELLFLTVFEPLHKTLLPLKVICIFPKSIHHNDWDIIDNASRLLMQDIGTACFNSQTPQYRTTVVTFCKLILDFDHGRRWSLFLACGMQTILWLWTLTHSVSLVGQGNVARQIFAISINIQFMTRNKLQGYHSIYDKDLCKHTTAVKTEDARH